LIIWINGAFGADQQAREFCLRNLDRGIAAAARQLAATLMLRSDKLSPAELADEIMSQLTGKVAIMADTDSNPENEYADHDAEDREQPGVSTEIPFDEPAADVLEQRQEVPLYEDEDEPWWDEADQEQDDRDAD
jgi:hypothetical protein